MKDVVPLKIIYCRANVSDANSKEKFIHLVDITFFFFFLTTGASYLSNIFHLMICVIKKKAQLLLKVHMPGLEM